MAQTRRGDLQFDNPIGNSTGLTFDQIYRFIPSLRLQDFRSQLRRRAHVAFDTSAVLALLRSTDKRIERIARRARALDLQLCIPSPVLDELFVGPDVQQTVRQLRTLVDFARAAGIENVKFLGGVRDFLRAEAKGRGGVVFVQEALLARLADEKNLVAALSDRKWRDERVKNAKENFKDVKRSKDEFEKWKDEGRFDGDYVSVFSEAARDFAMPANNFHLLENFISERMRGSSVESIFSTEITSYRAIKMLFSLIQLYWWANSLPKSPNDPYPVDVFRAKDKNDYADFGILATSSYSGLFVTQERKLRQKANFLSLGRGVTHTVAVSLEGLEYMLQEGEERLAKGRVPTEEQSVILYAPENNTFVLEDVDQDTLAFDEMLNEVLSRNSSIAQQLAA